MGIRPSFLTLQDKQLEEKINKLVSEGQAEHRISLQELTEFEWDSLYVIKPYSLQSTIEDTRIDLSQVRYNTRIEYHDVLIVIAFVKDEQLVRYIQPSSLGENWTVNRKTLDITWN